VLDVHARACGIFYAAAANTGRREFECACHAMELITTRKACPLLAARL